MIYTTVEKVQKFLDDKYGADKCYAFATTGLLPDNPKPMKSDYKTTVAPFHFFFYLGGAGPIISAIDVYSEDDVSFDGFDDFIEPPVELKMHDNVSGMVYSETLPMKMANTMRLMNGIRLSRDT